MSGPIILWPREIQLVDSGNSLTVTFRTDFESLRWGVNLEQFVSRAFEGYLPRVGSANGQHWVEFRVRGESLRLKHRVNRIFSALTLVHPEKDAPDVAMALGWNFFPGTREHTAVGDLEKRAKWSNDSEAIDSLVQRALRLVQAHDQLRQARSIVRVQSSKPFAERFAAGVAAGLGGLPVTVCHKRDFRIHQSSSDEALDYEALRRQAAGNYDIEASHCFEPVLILDDLYRSGATVLEVTKCLRAQGIKQVFLLTIAKTVQFHRQT